MTKILVYGAGPLGSLSDRIRVGSMLDYYGTYSSATRCDRTERDPPAPD